jgi:3-dehydroquinate synthase
MSEDQMADAAGHTPSPSFVLSFSLAARCEVFDGHGVLARTGDLLRSLQGGPPARVAVCSDETVFPLVGAGLLAALHEDGFNVESIVMPAGEEGKTFANVGESLRSLARHGFDRHDVLLAVGGGVPGDLFGFVAATYMRGIRLVQVPTTIVSQVDSSIGGKVGVDLPDGKNLVGTFKHPELVIIDYDLLATLPQAEFVSGTAEVAKHGVIADRDLFAWLEAHAGEWRSRTIDIGTVLSRAIEVKARIVQMDERETGVRMHLNYGHTLGHALEAEAGYSGVRHGEGVAWGMAMEARMAAALGMSNEAFVRRQDRLLTSLGLLQPLPQLDCDRVMARLSLDKKVKAGRLRWILPATEPGSVTVRDNVPAPLVRDLVEATVAGRLVEP